MYARRASAAPPPPGWYGVRGAEGVPRVWRRHPPPGGVGDGGRKPIQTKPNTTPPATPILDPKQQHILDLCLTGKNVFFSGIGGTGKTHLLLQIAEGMRRQLGHAKVAVAASTGVAARPALLIGVLAYAQAGHLYAPGDRGIDRILRTVLLIWAWPARMC